MAGMAPSRQVRTARVYDARSAGEGTRVLVDRLWPRGIPKEDDRHDVWLRDVAPSNELRRWYGHREEVFDEFRERYLQELEDPERAEALGELRRLVVEGPVTLVTATKEINLSHLAVLSEVLQTDR
jgi:uncharacterized protein YeaO (DUF488 family)